MVNFNFYKKSKMFWSFKNFLDGFSVPGLGWPESLMRTSMFRNTSGSPLTRSILDSSLSKSAVSISDCKHNRVDLNHIKLYLKLS